MNSWDNNIVDKRFSLSTVIYEESSIKNCFEKLKLCKNDLIIGSGRIYQEINFDCISEGARFLDISEFRKGEPKEEDVNKVLKVANEFPFRRIIAIGGGTTIDIAKLCVFGDGKDVSSLFKNKNSLIKKRELIAIPTTCGTGSEVTSVSVVEFSNIQSKLGLQIDALFPDKAILIGELLQTLPFKTFALTSIDALAHAIESLLSPKASAYTDMFASTAITGIAQNFLEVRKSHYLPKDLQKSLICANMAGIAFSIAGCATMHALSFPLGSNYYLAHGEAVYAVMASTLNFYKKRNVDLNKLEKTLRPLFKENDSIMSFLLLLSDIYACPDFIKLGINGDICSEMAISVFENQQRLLVNSPISLNSDDLTTIYKNCLKEKL